MDVVKYVLQHVLQFYLQNVCVYYKIVIYLHCQSNKLIYQPADRTTDSDRKALGTGSPAWTDEETEKANRVLTRLLYS